MTGWQILFLISSACFAYQGFRSLRDWAGVPSDVARYFLAALIAMLFVALTGCSTPAVKDRIVVEKVPVAVHSITPAQVPTAPAPLPPRQFQQDDCHIYLTPAQVPSAREPLQPRPSSLSAAADVLLADHCSWVAFGLKAFPLLRVSAGLPPSELPKYPECEGR